MLLPKPFVRRMEKILGDEIDAFIASYDLPPVRALRVNPLKMSVEEFEKTVDFPVKKIPHISGGYTFECEHIGAHPLHHGGCIYVQEPSAMAVIGAVDISENDDILDACAAPGGKTTHAGAQNINGVIVSNEIIPSRTKILLQNVERLGLKNTVVMNADSQSLGKFFQGRFDLTVVDAPCSGEGMMRKNDLAVSEWSEENVALCALRQREILENVHNTVKAGGTLIYSTCTFSLEENEMVVDAFLSKHSDFRLIPAKTEIAQISRDGIAFDGCSAEGIELCRRFYPHVSGGEGQFVAVMKREETNSSNPVKEATKSNKKRKREKSDARPRNESEITAVRRLVEECIGHCDFDIALLPDGAYALPMSDVPPRGVFSAGVKLCTLQKGRAVPHHQFFMAYGNEFINKIELSDALADKYLSGETFPCNNIRGFAAVTYHGAALGGVKVSDGIAKNYYPKGLRKI